MIDANELERMAKERPGEMFLKGTGVLKLTGAIRTLERKVAQLSSIIENSIVEEMGPIYLGQAIKGDEPRYITKEERVVIDAAVALEEAERVLDNDDHSDPNLNAFDKCVKCQVALIEAVKNLKGE